MSLLYAKKVLRWTSNQRAFGRKNFFFKSARFFFLVEPSINSPYRKEEQIFWAARRTNLGACLRIFYFI